MTASDRLKVCDACGGDGGGHDVTGHYGGEPVERWFECEACGGTGQIDVFAPRAPVQPDTFIADMDEEIPF